MCGNTSTGKTTACIRLPGSCWGHGGSELGFGESWFATASGLVEVIASHRSCMLGLDEAHLASDNPTERGRIIANVIHLLEKGKPKTTQKTGLVTQYSELVCISTSNDPLASYLQGTQASRDAISARMITIEIPKDRPHGVLKVLPKGFASSGEAIDRINAEIANHYGAPGWRYLKALVKMRHETPDKLLAIIRKHSEFMLRELKVDRNDGLAYRRAKPFALAYAATQLGRRWGVLPSQSEVGSYLEAFKTVWSWTAQRTPLAAQPSPVSALLSYWTTNRPQFRSLTKISALSDTKFARCVGFTRKIAGGGDELIMATAKFRSVFSFDQKTMKSLVSRRIIVGDGGSTQRNDTKRKVRLNPAGDPIKDRVIVIRIDRL